MLRHAPPEVDHAFSIDISDAYHHPRLAPEIEHLFQFKIDGEFFQARGLPFGWAPAPGVFTKFVRQVLAALRNPSRIST